MEGFKGGNRFICKEHWDVKYYARFRDLASLVAFKSSEIKQNLIDPVIKELEGIAKDGKVHLQNFVADDWD